MSENEGKQKKKGLWWKVLLGLFALAIVGSAMGDSEEPSATEGTQAPAQEAPAASQAVNETPATTASPVSTTAPKPKEWVKVVELSGKANKRSQAFELTGGQARLTYNVSGSTMPVCMIYVMEEGASLDKNGGFPEVNVTDAGSDSTYLTKGAGRYYLDISAANCNWTVTIEEER